MLNVFQSVEVRKPFCEPVEVGIENTPVVLLYDNGVTAESDVVVILAFHVAALVILESAKVPTHTGVKVCTPLAVVIVKLRFVSDEVAKV